MTTINPLKLRKNLKKFSPLSQKQIANKKLAYSRQENRMKKTIAKGRMKKTVATLKRPKFPWE